MIQSDSIVPQLCPSCTVSRDTLTYVHALQVWAESEVGKHGDAVSSRASGPRSPDVWNRIEQIKEPVYAQPRCDRRYEFEHEQTWVKP